jgi:pyrophosphatase PpaX
MKARLVIFDLDGTLVENNYDWAAIRQEIGLSSGSILAYLDGLPEPERSEKYAILEAHERRQTELARLRPGTEAFLGWLASCQIKTALVTNNNLGNTRRLIERFQLTFDLIMTRETGLYKPSGAPLIRVMKQLGVKPEETVAIGDTHYDLQAGREAGLARIFILEGPMTPPNLDGATLVSSYQEIKPYLLEER